MKFVEYHVINNYKTRSNYIIKNIIIETKKYIWINKLFLFIDIIMIHKYLTIGFFI